MGLKYPLDGSGDLPKVAGRPLVRSPFGWVLIVPSILRAAYKHLHGLTLNACLGRLSSGSLLWPPYLGLTQSVKIMVSIPSAYNPQ